MEQTHEKSWNKNYNCHPKKSLAQQSEQSGHKDPKSYSKNLKILAIVNKRYAQINHFLFSQGNPCIKAKHYKCDVMKNMTYLSERTQFSPGLTPTTDLT